MAHQFAVHIHHGEDGVFDWMVFDGDPIEPMEQITKGYLDKEPYLTEENGVKYFYSHAFQNLLQDENGNLLSFYDKNKTELYAVYQAYSVIDVPLNPHNTARKDGEYKVLSVSDLHFGFPPFIGDIKSPFPYTFFSGDMLYIDPGDPRKEIPEAAYLDSFGYAYAPRTLLFHAGTPVTYHEDATVEIGAEPVIYTAGECVMYKEDTAVTFHLPTVISIPDGTTVTFMHLNSYMRGLLLVDLLLREYTLTHYDCILLPGDIVSNECGHFYATNEMEDHFWHRLKTYYFNKLDNAGIPWFLVYGNHDDMDPEEWKALFPKYTKNFCIRLGENRAALCGFDTNATPNDDTESRNKVFYGTDSDIDKDAVKAFDSVIKGCTDAYAYMHFYTRAKPSLAEMKATYPNLRAVIVGHSHGVSCDALSPELNAYHVGHFSWNGSLNAAGLAGRNSDGSIIKANQIRPEASDALSGTWNFAYVESRIGGAKREALFYLTYPEFHYGDMVNNKVLAYDQPRYSAEGEADSPRYGILYCENDTFESYSPKGDAP